MKDAAVIVGVAGAVGQGRAGRQSTPAARWSVVGDGCGDGPEW